MSIVVIRYNYCKTQGLAVILWQRESLTASFSKTKTRKKPGSSSPWPWLVRRMHTSVCLTAMCRDANTCMNSFTVGRACEWEFRKLLQKFETERKRFSVWCLVWFASGIFLLVHGFTKFHFLPHSISLKNTVEFPRCANLPGYSGSSFLWLFLHLHQVDTETRADHCCF